MTKTTAATFAAAFVTIGVFRKQTRERHHAISPPIRRVGRWTATSRPPSRPQKHPQTVGQTRQATQTPKKEEYDYETVDPFKPGVNGWEVQQTATQVSPVVIVPGYGAPAANYQDLQGELQRVLPEGTPVKIVPVTIATWLRTVGGRPVTPVLELLDECVQDALSESDGAAHKEVTIVAHSAGGWIARIYLGGAPYPDASGRRWKGHEKVGKLVNLGTPQKSGERVARANMKFVNEQYPQAHHDSVQYYNFAGDAVRWCGQSWWMFWKPEWMAGLSYCLTDVELAEGRSGSSAVGDGIVPISVAFLQGAVNVRLKGVWHSPDSPGAWYGQSQVVDYWSRFLL